MNKGTFEGTEEEIFFVKELNLKKNLLFWKILGIDFENHFAVHIIKHKFGKINNSNIKSKADVFIAKGIIPISFLIKNDFYINEDNLNTFNLIPIEHTGISIKRKDSHKYQILKMNPSTFKKIFKSYELGCGASIFCNKFEGLNKNRSVIIGWNSTWEKFVAFFSKIKGVDSLNYNNFSESDLKIFKAIKNYSNQQIQQMIEKDKFISDFVFCGIGNFDEPFTATWFYEKGTLKKAEKIPFTVTTGSGRTKGDYTIVIKPL